MINETKPDSLALLGKLLATENITIIRQKVKTASFDIKSRVLTLPIYSNIEPVQELMLVLHEVGHALFTTEQYIQNIKDYGKKNFRFYMNVVEDARIESLMKEKFPGSRKDFFVGYNKFHETNFFGIAGKDVNTLSLVDRINLEFKLGFRIGTKFTKEERVFVNEIAEVKTEDAVFDIAKRLYEFAAKQKENKQKELDLEDVSFDDGDSSDEFSDEMEYEFDEDETSEEGEDESDENTDGSGEPGDSDNTEDSSDEAPAAETQENFDNNSEGICNTLGAPVVTVYMKNIADLNIVDTSSVIEELEPIYLITPEHKNYYKKFKLSNKKLVNHMVKEFEMRKAADSQKRTRVAKSGSISTSNLYKYKIADDIFKKYNISADATNHGFIMMLDWSGSMLSNLRGVVSQVITLTQFCMRVGIKFEVIAFSDEISLFYDGMTNRKLEKYNRQIYQHSLENYSETEDYFKTYQKVSLIKFFNDRMSAREFDIVATCLYNQTLTKKFQLSKTPIIHAMIYLNDYLKNWSSDRKVQKTTVITLTDGAPTDTVLSPSKENNRFFLFNHISNKSYPIKRHKIIGYDRSEYLKTIMVSMKDAYPEINFVGFFITSGTKTRIFRELSAIFSDVSENYIPFCKKVLQSLNEIGYHEMNAPGYDKFYIIKNTYATSDFDFNSISSDMSSATIARKFMKSAQNTMGSKIVSNKFIALIS